MAQVHRLLGPKTIVRLRAAGFTVADTGAPPAANTITKSGATNGQLARYLVGGRSQVVRLRKLGIWATA